MWASGRLVECRQVLGAEGGLHQVAMAKPQFAVRGEQSPPKEHLHAAQHLGLGEAARLVNQHVGNRSRVGDDVGRFPKEADLHDARDEFAALIEL